MVLEKEKSVTTEFVIQVAFGNISDALSYNSSNLESRAKVILRRKKVHYRYIFTLFF